MRRAPVWVSGALLLLVAPRCAPQDVYFFDPDVQTASGGPDAGASVPDPDTDDPDVVRPPVAGPAEPGSPDESYEPVQPACESAACEACLETGGCADAVLSLCHPQSGSCVAGCDPSVGDEAGNCPDATHCDPARGICLACVTSQDCAVPTPACDTTNGTCVGCVSGDDCTPAASVCDTAARECVECLADGDCAATFQVCRESTRRCVECESDADCVARRAPGDDDDDDRICSPGLRCVECLVDDDCTELDKPLCTSELECDDERE